MVEFLCKRQVQFKGKRFWGGQRLQSKLCREFRVQRLRFWNNFGGIFFDVGMFDFRSEGEKLIGRRLVLIYKWLVFKFEKKLEFYNRQCELRLQFLWVQFEVIFSRESVVLLVESIVQLGQFLGWYQGFGVGNSIV